MLHIEVLRPGGDWAWSVEACFVLFCFPFCLFLNPFNNASMDLQERNMDDGNEDTFHPSRCKHGRVRLPTCGFSHLHAQFFGLRF